MNNLTPAYEPETGQVTLDGQPAGPAGEAVLILAAGLELAFDRMDGHLVRVIADVAEDAAAAPLSHLFGAQAVPVLRDFAAGLTTASPELSPEPAVCAALSQLARLDATRLTSPVPRSSPWWSAEAALLAERAGLQARALAEAARAVRVLAGRPLIVPAFAAPTVRAVLNIAAADDPEAASRLRENWQVTDEPWRPAVPGLDVAAEVTDLETSPSLHWALELTGIFRPGLSPQSDLLVDHDSSAGTVTIEAFLLPDANSAAFDQYQARLVDPAIRRVLAQAPLRAKGKKVHAVLRSQYPLDELDEVWIDVVNGPRCPVQGASTHRIRRALRWADAALRAERAPAGLAPLSCPSDWAALAAIAWQRCHQDWAAAETSPPRVAIKPGPDFLAEQLGG